MTTSDVSFALPGTWYRIPVQNEKASLSAIRSFADDHIGKGDELATLRREMRTQLATAASEARLVGGQHMFIATDLVPGTPAGITLTTYIPNIPRPLSASISIQLAAESIASQLQNPAGTSDIDTWDGERVSVVREQRSVFHTNQDGEQAESLRVDYWLLREVDPDPLLLSFSAPVYVDDMRDALAELLDAIVSTCDWQEIELSDESH